jgi:hypothetical protein
MAVRQYMRGSKIDGAPRNFGGGYIGNADPSCGCDE